MNAQIIGAWDGSHLWLQWTKPDAGAIELRIRFAVAPPALDWGEWLPAMKPALDWFVHTARVREGTAVQAQIRAVVEEGRVYDAEEGWVTAQEAKFVRSVCEFEFATTKKDLHFLEGTNFHCHVDGAVCSYRLNEEIEVEAGSSKVVEMQALASGGYAQIDSENDFKLRPMLGVTIRNIEPSRNDTELTGRDFTQIARAKRDGPFGIVFRPRTDVR